MSQNAGWGPSGGMEFSGILPGQASSITRVPDAERLARAEQKTAELITRIQPTLTSELRRRAVANYVQQLIETRFPCQVCRYGSMPFKTYLPDGDIDLTACSKGEEEWIDHVYDMLKKEEENEDADFRIEGVKLIKARVPVIKCIVGNIDVDISFNKVNGLCALCFLDEIDGLVKQNHLFKRSIILIKAWCYYESCTLGAAKSLFSTYALEILVVYIFHVFNNSFAGPLEVLYRFLQFFSNFLWHTFYLSLWGPIPARIRRIGLAEPPRTDTDAVFLSKDFIDSCRKKYGVYTRDRQGEDELLFRKTPFTIVDPICIQNNLGCSVNEDSYPRINSAFAYGAKSLANLLHCPELDLIDELNKFFVNTLARVGNGYRLDAPYLSIQPLQPSNASSHEESNNSRSVSSSRRDNDHLKLSAGRAFNAEGPRSFQGPTRQIIRTMRGHTNNSVEQSTNIAACHIPSQRNICSQSNSIVSGQIEHCISSRVSFETDMNLKNSRPVDPLNDHGWQIRFQLARTNSSPELIDSSSEFSFQRSENDVLEIGKIQIAQARSDCVVERKDFIHEVSGSHSGRSLDDPSCLKHFSSHKSFQSVRLDGISSNNQDAGCTSDGGDLASASDTIELQQPGWGAQALTDMVASSSMYYNSGRIQVVMHFGSTHPAIPLSLSQATLNCAQRSSKGNFSGSVQAVDPCWTPNIKFPCTLMSPQVPHSYPTSGLNSNSEESGNDHGSFARTHHDDNDQVWPEEVAGSRRGFDLETTGSHMTHSDGKTEINPNDSGSPYMPGHYRFTRENGEPQHYDISAPQYRTSKSNNDDCIDGRESSGFLSVHQAGFSRHKPSSGSSWDESSRKPSKSVKGKRGRKPFADMASLHDKTKNVWQHEDSSDHFSSQADGEALPRARIHQLPGYGSPDISGSNSMFSISPLIVNSSQQKVVNNSGVVPFAFYPTGPPVPFLTMLPVYKFPSDKDKSNRSTAQLDNGEGFLHVQTSLCDQNLDSREHLDQLEPHPSSSDLRSSIPIEEHKSDILNSDFASYWQSLPYSQFCQHTHYQGPFIYRDSVVPPVYVQGYFPWDGPGRPLSASENLFPQVTSCGPRLVPVTILQPVPGRNSNVLPHFGGEIPRYRNGTGTYLPNPKLSFKGQQPSSSKHQRANQNYVRSDDRADTERSWTNSKSRAAERRYGRTQAERPRSQSDRSSASDNQANRTWNSQRNGPISSYHSSDNSFQSTKSNGSASVAHDPLPLLNSNSATPTGPSLPPVVMRYQCNQGVGYGFPAEALEFGSLGQQQFSSTNSMQPCSGVISPKG